MIPNFDFNVVGALTLVMAGFGYFVRLTIKGSISDLKDDLAKIYMSGSEMLARLASIYQRLETLEHYISISQGTNAR